LTETLHEAKLLGFIAASHLDQFTETIPIAQLQPLDALLEHLVKPEPITPPPIQLQRWLQQQVEIGWQTVDALLAGRSLNPAFRWMPVQRAKAIELADRRLAVVVTVTSATQLVTIHLQLCSIDESATLPILTLRLLTETREVFREITTAVADTFIQYEFTAEQGEEFAIEISCAAEHIQLCFVA
jgi:hypothetical protein